MKTAMQELWCCSGVSELEAFVPEKEGEGSLRVVEAGEGRGSVGVRLRHILEASCGIHILQISCALWVYNSAGLPIALQQSTDVEDDSLVSECTSSCPVQFLRTERKEKFSWLSAQRQN